MVRDAKRHLAACRELGVALVGATPLGRGLLTTRFSQGDAVSDATDVRPMMMPRFVSNFQRYARYCCRYVHIQHMIAATHSRMSRYSVT